MTEANPFAAGDSSKKHHTNNDAEGGKFSEDSLHTKYDKFLSRLSEVADSKWVSLDRLRLPSNLRCYDEKTR